MKTYIITSILITGLVCLTLDINAYGGASVTVVINGRSVPQTGQTGGYGWTNIGDTYPGGFTIVSADNGTNPPVIKANPGSGSSPEWLSLENAFISAPLLGGTLTIHATALFDDTIPNGIVSYQQTFVGWFLNSDSSGCTGCSLSADERIIQLSASVALPRLTCDSVSIDPINGSCVNNNTLTNVPLAAAARTHDATLGITFPSGMPRSMSTGPSGWGGYAGFSPWWERLLTKWRSLIDEHLLEGARSIPGFEKATIKQLHMAGKDQTLKVQKQK